MLANADVKDLEDRTRNGDTAAMIALGRHFELCNDHVRARGCFASAAKSESVPALTLLAISLLTKEPVVERDGVNMIRAAADKGDAEASYVCGMLAAQDPKLVERWSVARRYLEIAADSGWTLAQAQLDFLAREAEVKADVCDVSISAKFEAPRIRVIEDFASPEVCDWLIARAKPRMARALVYDRTAGFGTEEQVRTNSAFAFGVVDSDLILMRLRDRIAATVGVSLRDFEASSVLRYEPGQQFEPHVDFLDPANPAYAGDIAARGQRVATFLLYLNDNFEGGETDFPELGWRYRGRKGDALFFWNVTQSGTPEEKALHAGLPPQKGEKWILSQWIRQRHAA